MNNRRDGICYMCGGTGRYIHRNTCPMCGARIRYRDHIIEVTGTDAKEVLHVSESLMKSLPEKKDLPVKPNIWFTGSFYLAVAVIVMTMFMVIAQNVDIFALPIVIIGSLIMVSVISAFQLRNDKCLAEKNILSLMLLSFQQLPLIGRKSKTLPTLPPPATSKDSE